MSVDQPDPDIDLGWVADQNKRGRTIPSIATELGVRDSLLFSRLAAAGIEITSGRRKAATTINPDIPLTELGLTRRTLNALSNAGITTVNDLQGHTEEDLLALDGFTDWCLPVLIDELEDLEKRIQKDQGGSAPRLAPRPRRRGFKKLDVDWVIRELERGKGVHTSITVRVGCNSPHLYSRMASEGVEFEQYALLRPSHLPPRATPDEIKQCVHLHNQGALTREIAERLGRSTSWVLTTLRAEEEEAEPVRTRSYNEQERERALEQLAELPVAVVSAELDIGEATLRAWARQAGVRLVKPESKTFASDEAKREAVQRVRDTGSINQVADELGLKRDTLRAWAWKAGIR